MGRGAAALLCARQRRRLLSALGALAFAGVALLGSRRSGSGFAQPSASRAGSARSGAPLAGGLREAPAKVRGPAPMRLGPGGGADAVNNISPEMANQGRKYAVRYEELFLSGKNLWDKMKKAGNAKKFYFIGTNGNMANEIPEACMDAFGYIPAPDGTMFIHRKPGNDYPPIKYDLQFTDKEVSARSKIAAVDLYMDDPEKYRDLEAEVLREFAEAPDSGFPMGCVVGEGAILRESNIELMKQGVIIWLDVSPEYSWQKTQFRPSQGGGIAFQREDEERPPVWAIANGWDGDVDDTEAKMEYVKVVRAHNSVYESIADVRMRTDLPGIMENSYWAVERLVKVLMEYFGYSKDEVGVEEEALEKDLEKFLEGARLSKYLKPALKWCDEQGAGAIEDIVENIEDFTEAMKLKPLEKKRLDKAAATVVVA
mmetsp:Transcript_63422/g.136429  ORF Transcript_63422/g.136429 Transcript_63422/m.136429 type:complete len:427 (-) Transcript_63422:104-1384(-)